MWQPMKTAPKDGTWIVAFRPPANVGSWDTFVPVRWDQDLEDFVWPDRHCTVDPYTAAADDDDWLVGGDYYEAKGTFTHWMPLPDPPKTN
jgi:hypothetical protein